MEKYYTPTIEEFHIGFEFEYNSNKPGLLDCTDGKWQKEKFSAGCNDVDGEEVDQITNLLHDKNVRVKYLDREDIENLGWKFTGRSIDIWFSHPATDTPGGRHRITEYKMHYNLESHEMKINGYFGSMDEGCFFEGFIKNKSEFIRLMKQLNFPDGSTTTS